MESKSALIALPQQYNDPQSSSQHSTYGKPMPLHLDRKVFISHSGRDKDFVRFLYKELSSGYAGIQAVAFFDEKTLPKGEVVSMVNILKEAKSSEVGVLVLTDDFFMNTPNPMLELEAFVDGEVKLLPLFFSMSVNEFKEKHRRDKWEEKWREWVAKDNSLVINKWRSHLDVVSKFCGIEYCKTATNWVDFIDIVVKEVIGIIGPATPFCGNKVHGMARMCEVVHDMYGKCATKHSPSIDCTSTTQVASTSASSGHGESEYVGIKLDVVAIYGFPGLGKSTLCRCLCDFYYRNFHGNVLYIELGSPGTSRRHRMESVLLRLSRSQNNDSHLISGLSDVQVENRLKDRFHSMKDPIFLAIDNIPPDTESQEEADFYMSCKFKKGSKVFITSRSEAILTNLTNQHSHGFSVEIGYMLKLTLDEARDIFVQEFPDLREARPSNLPKEGKLESDVDAVLEMCTIHGKRYHPLMLKSLAAFVRWDPLTRNLDWKDRLANLAEEGMVHKDDALKKVFEVFDKTYSLLTEEATKVFLDLAIFQRATIFFTMSSYEWIQMLHSKPGKERHMEKILLQLQNLGFIESELSTIIGIQDLFLDYGKHKSDLQSDQYVVVEDGDAWPDEYGIPTSARHVSVSRCREAPRMVLDVRRVERMQVLHLLDNAGRQEVLLMHSTCAHLRSLIVRVPAGAELCWSLDTANWTSPCFNLVKCLELHGNITFCVTSPQDNSSMSPQMYPGSTFLGALRNLESLELVALPSSCAVQILDVTLSTRLKILSVHNMPGLKSIRGPENQSQLCSVSVSFLPHLQKLELPSTAADLAATIRECDSLESFVLGPGTRSSSWCAGAAVTEFGYDRCSSMKVSDCPRLTNVDGLSQSVVHEASFEVGAASELGDTPHKFLTDMFGEMVKGAGIDSSLCKAVVDKLTFHRPNNTSGLAGRIKCLCLREAQHIGMLITALFKVQPREVEHLEITCQQGGNCGCDHNVPQFGPGPVSHISDKHYEGETDVLSVFHRHQYLRYTCPRVRDLASLSYAYPPLDTLILKGCTAVEIWPDFSVMTSLRHLDLSNTSLKEWPKSQASFGQLDTLILKWCTAMEVWPDFSVMTSLRHLDLSNTSLKEWPKSQASFGWHLDLSNTSLKEWPESQASFGRHLDLSNTTLREWPKSQASFGQLDTLILKGCTAMEVWPDFSVMPSLRHLDLSNTSLKEWPKPQASFGRLETLTLKGCTAMEVWPDFSVMRSLQDLDLSNTSLKECPTGVLGLFRLRHLNLQDCKQLPAKEMIFNGIASLNLKLVQKTRHNVKSIIASLCCLRDDLMHGTRERSTVADALEALSLEIVALFDSWSPSYIYEMQQSVTHLVVELMYRACFGSVGVSHDVGQELDMATRMKGLLCNGSFFSFAYRACSDMCWFYKNKWIVDPRGFRHPVRMNFPDRAMCLMGIALVAKARILGACYNGAPALSDDSDRDAIINYRDEILHGLQFGDEEARALIERVKTVVSTTSTESGKDIMDAISEALRSSVWEKCPSVSEICFQVWERNCFAYLPIEDV